MPNWIEGTCKLRGSPDDLYRFFKTGVEEPGNGVGAKREDYIETWKQEEYYDVYIKEDAYISGMHRAFANDDQELFIPLAESKPGKPEVVFFPIRQAWSFRSEEWRQLSEKYNLDIRLFGFECGAQFCQDIEIINGKITKDEVIQYGNWVWDCPMPGMGG